MSPAREGREGIGTMGTALANLGTQRSGEPMGTNTNDRAAQRRDEAPVLCILDDDAATLDLVRDVAEECGWVAYGFSRISEVRQFLSGRRPTLLMLDDDLPDGRGGDLARELQQDESLGDLPMVVCTAAHPARQKEIGGWAPVISKPFELEEFERHLEASFPRPASRLRRQPTAG